MWEFLKYSTIQWLKAQFRGNPLVENTGEYLGKFAQAIQVGLIGVVSFIALGFLGSVVFVIGSLRDWF